MSQPIFHLLAGPNGAGKSTLYRALAASGAIESDLEFVNADLHERDCLQHAPVLQDAVEVEQGAYRLVALCEKGQTTLLVDGLPRWAAAMLAAK